MGCPTPELAAQRLQAPMLTHEEVNVLAREVLRETAEDLRLIGVSSAESGSGRIEVFLMIEGCHDAPCVISLNLARTGSAQFEHDLASKLVIALEGHRSQGKP